MDGTTLRQCKLGELRRAATVSRPDICARFARIASRINALSGSDAHRINELVRVATAWQHATVLKYVSPSRSWKTLGGGGRKTDGREKRGEMAHCGSMSLVGWSDAAFGTGRRKGSVDSVT